jgi:hypothetical protein
MTLLARNISPTFEAVLEEKIRAEYVQFNRRERSVSAPDLL